MEEKFVFANSPSLWPSMTMTDPLGDMLTRIRNGQRVGKRNVRFPASNLRGKVLAVLTKEGYTEVPPTEELEARRHVAEGREYLSGVR